MKQKPPIDILEAEKALGAAATDALQGFFSFMRDWSKHAPLEMRDGVPVVRINHPDLERSFQMLEVYGVSRERARYVSQGIDVLGTRFNKEIQSLSVSPAYNMKAYVEGRTTLANLAIVLGMKPEELKEFAQACVHKKE